MFSPARPPHRKVFYAVLLSLGLLWAGHSSYFLCPTPAPASGEERDELGRPTFAEVREHERSLPQHKSAVGAVRYLHLPDEAWGGGLNNVFQAVLINTHLAYLMHRGYVFKDYVAHSHPPFPDALSSGTRDPLRIPMNAITSGPTGSGSLGTGTNEAVTPRAISQDRWDEVCPASKVVVVELDATNAELNITGDTGGLAKMERWAAKSRDMEAPCVKITGGEPFDWMIIASTKILELWPSYGSSPTLKEFAWSALVTRALSRNFSLLSSVSNRPALLSPFLPRISSSWTGFGNPPDYLDVLEGKTRSEAAYEHCWPTAEAIVRRALAVRADSASGKDFGSQRLTAVYIATNGEPEWIAVLVALFKRNGWDRVSTSLDMELAPEEYAVSQVVDMSVMVAAESFIGVGFSSLTSNVVQLRLAAGRHPGTTRFW
ncbi:hypothetical protein FB45DRAFT_1034652 [Roridomyces roridus]|uniref:Uncharacterized protein n=1 Tax=Roridomyces roridus TaxID=1738132 RepID=A0AAD7BDN9_9AGAR|nr:hypothetical protein FB45DRAFT_1034652 [Roridomyces roridus]